MGFSLVLHSNVPKDELCGVVVGHGKFGLARFKERCARVLTEM